MWKLSWFSKSACSKASVHQFSWNSETLKFLILGTAATAAAFSQVLVAACENKVEIRIQLEKIPIPCNFYGKISKPVPEIQKTGIIPIRLSPYW